MLGYSRQYYYKLCQQQQSQHQEQLQVKKLVEKHRKLLPRLGGKKLYWLLAYDLHQHQIKMGRDKVFEVLRAHDLLIKPRRRYVQTTFSRHWLRKYPNLVKGLVLSRPEQVWVSDITYIKTHEGMLYLSLVTDAYSRRIMGYELADSLETGKMKKAFQMALAHRKQHQPLIHHSDRGVQYCSVEYVQLALANQVAISMSQQGDPYENALAERMNRTIKEEFGLGEVIATKHIAGLLVHQAVELYNNYRPHLALKMKTPQQVHYNKKIPATSGNWDLS